MSKNFFTFNLIPRDPQNHVDILRSHINAILMAANKTPDGVDPADLTAFIQESACGLLEDCKKGTSFQTNEEMVQAALTDITNCNTLELYNDASLIYPPPEEPQVALDPAVIANSPIIEVYRILVLIKKTATVSFDFRCIQQYYKNIYKEELTPQSLAQQLHVDFETHRDFEDIFKASGMFFISCSLPLRIKANSKLCRFINVSQRPSRVIFQ